MKVGEKGCTMNNAAYGQTMGNLKNRVEVKT